ncbi:MAG TPA: serine/threonine-protein kinase, partial [Gemmatimonadales bacterium]|nr:serine/threonine-protein kinase [Gemmatimonadales bacterium]
MGAELDPERWELASRLFEAAVALPERERATYLAAATRDDEVRRAVEHLLAADASAAPLLDATPGELAAAARSPDDEDSALIGARIGPWRIVRELGRGGMGAVYLAERADGAYEKLVAVKVVKRGMDTDEILRRFRRERQILASLEHPNIARLHDGGVTPDGRPYLVMEHIEGERIDRYADSRRLDVEARLALALSVCRAVEYAHRRRIVHRDIKPSNILVTADGDIRLLDFGIARLLDDDPDGATRTGTGRQILTPAYASPEQLAGSPVTPAGDVFALGVLLHELLTGRRPPDPLTPATPVSGGSAHTPRL